MMLQNSFKGGGKFIIRNFRSGDLEKVVYINRTCLPENYSPDFFIEHHLRWPEAFYVAEVGGEVVGYVMSRVEWGWSYVKRGIVKKGHIISIAVLPEHRRIGIGRSLMVSAMKSLKDRYNCGEVYLEVRVSNVPAINLYKSLKFRIVKKIPFYYLDGEDAYLMAADLRGLD